MQYYHVQVDLIETETTTNTKHVVERFGVSVVSEKVGKEKMRQARKLLLGDR